MQYHTVYVNQLLTAWHWLPHPVVILLFFILSLVMKKAHNSSVAFDEYTIVVLS